jgi:uncharacterized integral membrane protein
MSEQQPGATPPSSTKPTREGIPWRLVALGAVGVYAFLLVILNTDEVDVQFVFWSAKTSLVILLLIVLAIGFLGGFLFDTWRERRKRGQA